MPVRPWKSFREVVPLDEGHVAEILPMLYSCIDQCFIAERDSARASSARRIAVSAKTLIGGINRSQTRGAVFAQGS